MGSFGTAERKEAARRAAKRIIAELPRERRLSAANKACSYMKSGVAWREARCVLAYLSFGNELGADPLIEAALEEGKTVFVPKVTGDELEFRRLENLSGPFETGPFGIREPGPSLPLWNSMAVPGPSLIVVPGLAFDRSGCRLGRGAGFYDRFLARIRLEAAAAGEKPPVCLGYGYAEQMIESVPTDSGDERLDGIVTDGGMHRAVLR